MQLVVTSVGVCVFVVFYLFFFFKQKTAYEMRISDWSSDVCSSDLSRLNERLDARRRRLVVVSASCRIEALSSGCVLQNVVSILQLKIGRASCRERVCQYV